MKIVIAYFSKFGNGRRAVDYLYNAFVKKGHIVQVLPIIEVKPKDLPGADVYVFSTPTQIGNVAGKMRKFIKQMAVPEGARYGLLMTHASNRPAVQKMESLASARGMVKVAQTTLKVMDIKGPFEEGWEQKLDGFAAQVTA